MLGASREEDWISVVAGGGRAKHGEGGKWRSKVENHVEEINKEKSIENVVERV